MSHGRTVIWPIWVLLTPVILVVAYFVAYVALVVPEAFYVARYRFGGEVAATAFRPLVGWDQFLFPERWESDYYQFEGIVYFPPGPEFELTNQSASQKAYVAEAERR
jgi:hypothetical protein